MATASPGFFIHDATDQRDAVVIVPLTDDYELVRGAYPGLLEYVEHVVLGVGAFERGQWCRVGGGVEQLTFDVF